MKAIWVEITSTKGSTPRDAGTVMQVTESEIKGTIGGGALEFAAIKRARRMLAAGQSVFAETLPLGPNLGQCCGGSVSLRYADVPAAAGEDECDIPLISGAQLASASKDLWLWGAGHVGRAVVRAAPVSAFRITWVDRGPDRFPDEDFPHVTALPAADMPLLAQRAARQADHLIFTYSHEIDLALCAALLRRGVRSCGVIGSETKWARFQKRLRAMGLDPSPIACPIGDKRLGKAPRQIAQGVVANLLKEERMSA